MRSLVLVIVLALALSPDALAGIAVDAVTPHSVRAGDSLRVGVSAGLRLSETIPLYPVPSSRALRPKPCQAGSRFTAASATEDRVTA
jgi:hypothetical protein